jgi:hypothetical protein
MSSIMRRRSWLIVSVVIETSCPQVERSRWSVSVGEGAKAIPKRALRSG